ncbi:MAG: HAD-IB family hydrolase [Actinomycetota bacterium]|nr:HAD-IB family hydrolase [Actinomycetota bacterium]
MEIAFFDLDKTIVARSSPLALGRSFFKEGLIGRSWLIKSVYAQLMFNLMGADEDKMTKMQKAAAKMTEGWEAAKVRQVVSEVLEDVISPLIYAEALELMHDHRAAGRVVCIVSSSPVEIVEPLANMLQVNQFIASRPRIEKGMYTGELEFYAYGENKVKALREAAEELEAELSNCFAYSDSVTDLPMLEAVGNPVAVNPDRELRKIAIERGWTIENFKNPVTLRDRLPDWDLRARMPELNFRQRFPDVNLNLPDWRIRDQIPEWDLRARLDGLKRFEPGVENVVWVSLGVAGIAAAAWWFARKAGSRSE